MNNNRKGTFGILFVYYTLFYKITSGTKSLKKIILSDILLKTFFRNFPNFPL